MKTWNIGGVTFPDGPFMVGAGACKTPNATKKWLSVLPVVSGSYTQEPRAGNEGTVFYPETLEEVLEKGFALNSYGMPNMGFAGAAKELAQIESAQPLIISVAGFSWQEYVAGTHLFSKVQNVSAIELNFGCPNTQGEHAGIISFSPDMVHGILQKVSDMSGMKKPIWLKLSPYTNPQDLQAVARVINYFASQMQLAVVTCNTVPNAYAGKDSIGPNRGMAGLSGPAIKTLALGQVVQFRNDLRTDVDVIGAGGVTTGNDIVDFLNAGAAGVQATTLPHWADSPYEVTKMLADETVSGNYLNLIT